MKYYFESKDRWIADPELGKGFTKNPIEAWTFDTNVGILYPADLLHGLQEEFPSLAEFSVKTHSFEYMVLPGSEIDEHTSLYDRATHDIWGNFGGGYHQLRTSMSMGTNPKLSTP